MPFKKGKKKTGGRMPGVVNYKTRSVDELRAVLKEILDSKMDKIPEWIERTANRSPSKAVELIANLAEYTIPRLSRTELTGRNGEDLTINVFTNDPTVSEEIKSLK